MLVRKGVKSEEKSIKPKEKSRSFAMSVLHWSPYEVPCRVRAVGWLAERVAILRGRPKMCGAHGFKRTAWVSLQWFMVMHKV